MLRSLQISNYALISEMKIDFDPGFSVITGETGAGKSIIIGALSLILGQRADSRSIKEGEQKCIIEADFSVQGYHLTSFFEENELDFDGSNCLIRRELTVTGKSRAFINDTPVSLGQLRDLSSRLIDIHSQHENLLLSDNAYQLGVLDVIAKNDLLQAEYQKDYEGFKTLQSELQKLKETIEKQLADVEYIRFQYQQLSDANLVEDELAILEQEQETLSHAGEIKTELVSAVHSLNADQMSIHLLREVLNSVEKIRNYIQPGMDWAERLQSVYIELKDIAQEIESFEEQLESDPRRLEWVEGRLSDLFGYLKKYRVESVADLIKLRDDYDLQLQRIESFDEEFEVQQKKLASARTKLKDTAALLTASRKKVVPQIEDYLIQQLSQLGMPNVQFKVEIKPLTYFSDRGEDAVEFLFSANKNKTLQAVQQIASGGEIARVMLAIKSLIAHRAGLPTIIFDEIDTGVSGEIAYKMGEIMKSMSADMQVITITHLPQIAAKGTQQYKVYKDETGKEAQTFIQYLTPEQRITEIAQMLSGKHITDAALKQAEQLLN